MALPASGAISWSAIQAEFGGSNPINISEYYRGGGLVPDIAANSAVPTSGAISASNFYGATAEAPDVIPNAVNWANISGFGAGENANQTITGINQTISINWTVVGTAGISYSLNNGTWNYGSSVNIVSGNTLRFRAEDGLGSGASGSVTVRNGSNGNVTLDTFNYSV